MDNIRINPIQAYIYAKSSDSGYFGSGSRSGGNKESHSGQSFQEVFEQLLEKRSLESQSTHMRKTIR